VSYVNYKQQRDYSCDKDHTIQNKCNPTISQSLKTLLSLLLGDRRDQFNETYIGKTENPVVLIIQDVLSQNKQEEGHDVEALHSIMICHFVQILLAHPLEDITLYFRKVVGYKKCEKHVIL
jgi:hypothetical protein